MKHVLQHQTPAFLKHHCQQICPIIQEFEMRQCCTSHQNIHGDSFKCFKSPSTNYIRPAIPTWTGRGTCEFGDLRGVTSQGISTVNTCCGVLEAWVWGTTGIIWNDDQIAGKNSHQSSSLIDFPGKGIDHNKKRTSCCSAEPLLFRLVVSLTINIALIDANVRNSVSIFNLHGEVS